MTTPGVFSTAIPISATINESNAPAMRAYRTRTSFVAVHFDRSGKGRIVFLPAGVKLHVIGPSSCLSEGVEVMFENRIYNVFEVDLEARSRLIRVPVRMQRRPVAACA